jgi:transposase InsO family protein
MPDYTAAPAAVRGVCSMSRRGNCYDNAAMDSFWGP